MVVLVGRDAGIYFMVIRGTSVISVTAEDSALCLDFSFA